MIKLFKRFSLLLLVFVLSFLIFMPVRASSGGYTFPDGFTVPDDKYYYAFFTQDSIGNIYQCTSYSDVPCIFYEDVDGNLYIYFSESGTWGYHLHESHRCGIFNMTRWAWVRSYTPNTYQAGSFCLFVPAGSYTGILPDYEPTDSRIVHRETDNILVFDSFESAELYATTGGISGLVYSSGGIVEGGGSGTGGPVTDDMLEGIWGGIIDQEVVLEEDDGTVLGAIRTWIKNLGNMFSSPLNTIKNLIKKIPLSTITVLEGSNFFDKILQLVNDVNSLKFDLFENFKETGPGEMLFDIVDAVNTFKLQLFDNFAESELGKTLFGIVDSVNGFKLQLFDNFAESELGKKLFEIVDYINGLPGEIIKFFLESDFGDLLDLVNTVNDLKTEIPKGIMEYLGDKLELLFVPDKANLEARITSIREEFAFVDSLFEAGKHILNTLEASTGRSAPVITVDLSKYSGSHYWGNQKVVIDFSWYAPYKESVDIVIASIIWVTWLWSVWKRLPEIISGAGMVTDVQSMSADIGRGSRPKPARDFIIVPRGKGK